MANYGVEQVTVTDREYSGSRYAEVRNAVFANAYQPVWKGPGHFPTYDVTLRDVLHGVLSFGRRYLFEQASARIIDSHADLRWGNDGRGFRRILHPNGICLFGEWEITDPTEYSGYFEHGSKGLVIGRYSVCCGETRSGHSRSMAMAVKLFPTQDGNEPDRLTTATLITQQDLGGDTGTNINDVELRNAPDTTSWRRGTGLPVFAITGVVFNIVDRQPTIRQLYEIAELTKPSTEATRAPEFLRLLVSAEQPRLTGVDLDFRDEIMQHIFDAGDPTPRRLLRFDIEVTDGGQTFGFPAFQRRTFHGWRRIGSLTFDDAVASYNGDFVIHFHHPTWRSDRNDPSTATRVGERKVGGK